MFYVWVLCSYVIFRSFAGYTYLEKTNEVHIQVKRYCRGYCPQHIRNERYTHSQVSVMNTFHMAEDKQDDQGKDGETNTTRLDDLYTLLLLWVVKGNGRAINWQQHKAVR